MTATEALPFPGGEDPERVRARAALRVSDATIARCAQRDHPWSAYNPWSDRTWCRCGQRQTAGEPATGWDDGDGEAAREERPVWM